MSFFRLFTVQYRGHGRYGRKRLGLRTSSSKIAFSGVVQTLPWSHWVCSCTQGHGATVDDWRQHEVHPRTPGSPPEPPGPEPAPACDASAHAGSAARSRRSSSVSPPPAATPLPYFLPYGPAASAIRHGCSGSPGHTGPGPNTPRTGSWCVGIDGVLTLPPAPGRSLPGAGSPEPSLVLGSTPDLSFSTP